MRHFIYEFIRVSGGRNITILDLIKLCCYFTKESCLFGEECETLMSNYKYLNIEPKYVHNRTEFGFQQYLKYVPYSVLIEDLEYAFVGQIQARIEQLANMSDDGRRNDEGQPSIEFPLSKWQMKSIFDEPPKRKEKEEGYREYIEY